MNIGDDELYKVPLIHRLVDGFGAVYHRSQFGPVHDGGIALHFDGDPGKYLRPGDTLVLEISVDPAFSPVDYTIQWASAKAPISINGPRLVLEIKPVHVGRQFDIQCRVVTNNEWHRMHLGADDFMFLTYRVLPPVG